MNKITLIFIVCLTSLNLMAQIGFERHLNNSGSIDNFIIMQYAIGADMDSDGDEDVIVVLEAENRIVWFENLDGAGSFSRIQNLISEEGAYATVLAADVDGDDDLDIIMRSKETYNFIWLENNLSDENNWTNIHIINSNQSSGIGSVSARDLDGDGDLDLIARGTSSSILIYENSNGAGDFINIPGFIYGINPGAAGAIDIDNDNDLDLIVTYSSTNEIGWFENDGDNNFDNFTLIDASVAGPAGATIVDIDGDNLDDLIVRSVTNKKILWLKNSGNNGVFETPALIMSYEDTQFSIRLKDMDNNGTIDLAYVAPTSDEFGWASNYGNGVFYAPEALAYDLKKPSYIDITDFNGDGINDILGTSDFEGRAVWYDVSDPFFITDHPVYSDVLGSSAVHSSDLDNDGDTDIISMSFADGLLFWRENVDGNGDQMTFRNIADLEGITSVSTADLTGNARQDIIYTSFTDNYVRYRINYSSLVFSNVVNIDSNLEGAADAKAKDLDADGDIDVVAVGYYSNKIYWYENNGSGLFIKHELSDSFSGGCAVYIEDLNNDGRPDIIAASPISNTIIWFENIDGGFEAPSLITDQVFDVTSLYVKDLDADGLKDVIFGSLGYVSVGWLKNIDQASSFSAINPIALKTYARDVTAADIDGDSDYDIVSSLLRTNYLFWYENTNGSGSFSNLKNIGAATETTSVFPVDIDNDLDIDFVTAALNSTSTPWFENLGSLDNQIFGIVHLDLDSNGCDNNDPPMPSALVSTSNGGNSFSTFTDTNGDYSLNVNIGSFNTEVTNDFYGLFTVQPASHTSVFTNNQNSDIADFCIVPEQIADDLVVEIYPLTSAAPGFEADYLIVYKNVGTTILNGLIQFNYDGTKLDFLNSSESPFQQDLNNLTFNFNDLIPFQTRTILVTLELRIPPTNQIGDVLVFEAFIGPTDDDVTIDNNSFTLSELVVGSFDPNDIQVLEGDQVSIDDSDDYLHYIIRFQNTGTAPAISVKVTNIIDANLDWRTMQLMYTSHPCEIDIVDGKRVNFNFANINLPDSTNNEPESHGYILYKIKPKSTIEIGDTVLSTADIFFDFNNPITTNVVSTTYVDVLGISDVSENYLKLYPVPAKNHIFIKSPSLITHLQVFNSLGQLCLDSKDAHGLDQIDITYFAKGAYLVKLMDENQRERTKFFIKY